MILKCSVCGVEVERERHFERVVCFDCKMKRIAEGDRERRLETRGGLPRPKRPSQEELYKKLKELFEEPIVLEDRLSDRTIMVVRTPR